MAPHIRSHRAPCYCFPKKVSLQLSSEQSVGDVRITQLDWKRVPQARSGGCKSSVATAVLGYRHAGCLQLSHVWIADPSANGRRSAASRTAIGGGGISSHRPRGDNLRLFDFNTRLQASRKQFDIGSAKALLPFPPFLSLFCILPPLKSRPL